MLKKQLHHELLYFGLSGIIGTLADFAIYCFLNIFLTYSIAKTISFLLGSVIVYHLNQFFTFKIQKKSTAQFMRFVALYCCTLIINVSINSAGLYCLSQNSALPHALMILLAFIIATAVSTVINFIGQKYLVFKS